MLARRYSRGSHSSVRKLQFLCLLGLVLAACQAPAPSSPESSVKPGINTEYLKPGLEVSQWVERFEKEGREIYDHRHEILAAAKIRPGMKVADIGSGTGMFTLLMADKVGPKGKVYAVDIVPKFLEHIRDRGAKAGLANIETILCTERSVELPARSVELAFICDVYHHFEYPRSSMASLHRALKPGGEVFLIDFKRIPGVSSEWTMNHVRAGQEVVTKEIESAGFEKIGELDLLENNYVLRFRKTGK